MKITFVTHAELVMVPDQPENEATFRQVNATEATYAILPAEGYRRLMAIAANERVARAASDAFSAVIADIFENCPQAADAYFRALEKHEEEKRNANF